MEKQQWDQLRFKSLLISPSALNQDVAFRKAIVIYKLFKWVLWIHLHFGFGVHFVEHSIW